MSARPKATYLSPTHNKQPSFVHGYSYHSHEQKPYTTKAEIRDCKF